ncbi:hypothetical protein AAG570_005742 [Ranatra chinensis]|uniref:Uncharacterized protein n=1 Tax=Ranatra chinensis TaxID=642074 RepID=A0ABD0XZ97_9HEMI
MIEKMETFSSNFWAEIFGFIHIFINFIMAFIMQFFKFLLFTIVRPLMVGILQLASDYFWKPFLTILFNGIFQPVIIFFYNLATSLRDLALPVAQGMGYFLREFAVLIRAFRLVDVKNSINNGPFTLPQ